MKITKVEAEYILNKADVNWEIINEWIEAGQTKNCSLKLVYFTTIPDKLLEKYEKYSKKSKMQCLQR